MSSPVAWGQRALEHARIIARSPRGSATQAETNAARYVQGRLAALGIQDVQMQPFHGLRSIWLFLSLAFGLALVGHAAYWLLGGALGRWQGLGVVFLAFGLSGWLLWRKFTYRDYPLRQALPHGPSQNVLAVIPPTGEVQRKVVLVGHLDSHRAVFWYATDFLVEFYAASAPLAMYGVFAAPLLYLLAELTSWQFFAWVNLYFAFNHLLGWFTGITADLGAYSPGANDNASAVGTLLALAERLKQEPLQHTETWLAFTGCEESGCDGMLALLRQHGEQLKEALFIDFELVGIGSRLVYGQSEGMLRRKRIPAEVERLVKQAGEAFGLQPALAHSSGYFTEAGTAWEYGYQAVCLMVQRPESVLLPEWHRLSDTSDNLQPEALSLAHELGWELMRSGD